MLFTQHLEIAGFLEPIEPERLSEVIAQLPLPQSVSQASTAKKQKKKVVSPLGRHMSSKAEQEAALGSDHVEDKGAESCDQEGNVDGSSEEEDSDESDSDIVDESQSN